MSDNVNDETTEPTTEPTEPTEEAIPDFNTDADGNLVLNVQEAMKLADSLLQAGKEVIRLRSNYKNLIAGIEFLVKISEETNTISFDDLALMLAAHDRQIEAIRKTLDEQLNMGNMPDPFDDESVVYVVPVTPAPEAENN